LATDIIGDEGVIKKYLKRKHSGINLENMAKILDRTEKILELNELNDGYYAPILTQYERLAHMDGYDGICVKIHLGKTMRIPDILDVITCIDTDCGSTINLMSNFNKIPQISGKTIRLPHNAYNFYTLPEKIDLTITGINYTMAYKDKNEPEIW
jgi:hypothetical protein